MKRILPVLLFTSSIFLWSCNDPKKLDTPLPVEKEAVISTEKTQEVLNHHLTAFGKNDLDDVMADYTDNSLVITPEATYTSLAAIRGLFENLFAFFPAEGTEFKVDQMVVQDDLAYIVWHASSPLIEAPMGTDTYLIEDGKIMRQTFAGVINPKESK